MKNRLQHPEAGNWLAARADRLKDRFQVHARFYASSKDLRCRDELLITAVRPIGRSAPQLADAVFVMMNPGDSKPLTGDDESAHSKALHAPTRPDLTQYQLMRVMASFDWDFVRVLNLSDLRTPKSAKLPGLIAEYEQKEGHDGHSIFSPRRREDLEKALVRRDGAPVIAAWGIRTNLRPLAERALCALQDCQILGLRHSTAPWKFLHPLPRKNSAQMAWCNGVNRLVTGRPANC
jgi:hypothetical protein